MTAHLRSGSAWKTISQIYIRVSGQWKTVNSGFIRVAGAWKQFFSSALTIAQQVQISQSTNSTTKLITLTGTNYNWTPGTPTLTYKFERSIDAEATWPDNLNNGSITNPSAGSSNTVTYSLPSTAPGLGVIPNVLNYYRFSVTATSGAQSTTSTSTSTIIQGPTNITISEGTKTTTSVVINWNSSSGANGYRVERSTDNITYSTVEVVLAPATSHTSSALTSGATYYFKVTPITGTSTTYPGYSGNTSNTLTVSLAFPPNPPTGLYADAITKNDFFLGWSASAVDSTHAAAESYDYGVSTSNITAPSTLITSGSPTPGQYRNKLIADTTRYEIVSGLSPSTTYYGWVRAKNSAGTSSWAVSSAVTTLALKPPNNVTNLQHDAASRTTISLRFTWTAPTVDSTHDAATIYQYYYDTSSSASPPTTPNETADSSTNVTIGGAFFPLNSNTTYYFWVRGKNNDGTSASWTGPVSGTTLAVSNPPGAPTSATLTIPSTSGMTLSWTQGTGGTPTSYEVAFSTSTTPPTTTSIFTPIENWYDTGSTSTSYRVVGLSSGTTYYAWVRAKNNDGTSGNSNRPSLATRTYTVSNPSWTTSNFQRQTTTPVFMRWGWANGTATTSGTGTGSGMTIAGFYWEIYTTQTGTTIWDSGYKFYNTTTAGSVNGVAYPYILNYTSSTTPAYTTSSRWGRIQMEAYDYDTTTYVAGWTGRV